MRRSRDDRFRVAQRDIGVDLREAVVVVFGHAVLVHRRGFEDSASDEDAFGSELHHQRRVGGRGDAAGAKEHDVQVYDKQ